MEERVRDETLAFRFRLLPTLLSPTSVWNCEVHVLSLAGCLCLAGADRDVDTQLRGR